MPDDKDLVARLRRGPITVGVLDEAADYIERTAAPADRCECFGDRGIHASTHARVGSNVRHCDLCGKPVAEGSTDALTAINVAAVPADLVLTRLDLRDAGKDADGACWATLGPDPEGAWVSYEDAAAVLAAANERAASETKRADDWRRVARDDLYNATCRAEKAEAERDREAAARRTAELNAAQLDKDLETEVAQCARAEKLAAEEKAARFVAEDRAEQAEAERATLRAALTSVLAACDEGRMVESGPGGMTIDAQIRRSVINGVPAWPIEEARAALATTSTGEGS